MDINAAASLQMMMKNNPYKPKQSEEKGGNDFEKLLNEISARKERKTLKNDRTTQESYDAVLGGSGMRYNQISRNDGSESVSESEESVMGVSEISGTGTENQTADTASGIAFGDVTDAFTDMIATELLTQYITKKYPLGTGGQNPKEEFSGEVSDVMFDVMEKYSGFTKTQMTNPNMTVDVMGLDEFVNDDFISDITNDIISVVFNGDVKDKALTGQVIKNAVEQTILNPQSVQTVSQNVMSSTQPVAAEAGIQVAAENVQQIPAQQDIAFTPETAVVNNAANVNNVTEQVQPQEPEVRMILMTDGTYIPETSIINTGVVQPDEKGIYPAGTPYIQSTPFIGPGSSPAVAVLMSKVGDADGIVKPSDFVKAHNITFTRHENIPEVMGDAVYMPINGAVSGVIEYDGSENPADMMGDNGGQENGSLDFAQQSMQSGEFAMNTDIISDANSEPVITTSFEVPANSQAQAVAQITERMTNNLIQSHDGTVKQMQIQLHPETLGNIVIKLESVQGEVSVKIIASNPEVRDMIAQSAAQMSDSIRSQGVNLANIEVTHSQENRESFDGSGGNAGYYNDSQQQNQNERQKRDDVPDYSEYMKAAENEKIRRVMESIRSFGA